MFAGHCFKSEEYPDLGLRMRNNVQSKQDVSEVLCNAYSRFKYEDILGPESTIERSQRQYIHSPAR